MREFIEQISSHSKTLETPEELEPLLSQFLEEELTRIANPTKPIQHNADKQIRPALISIIRNTKPDSKDPQSTFHKRMSIIYLEFPDITTRDGYDFINLNHGSKAFKKASINPIEEAPSLNRKDIIKLIMERMHYIGKYALQYKDPSKEFPDSPSLYLLSCIRVNNFENLIKLVGLLEAICSSSFSQEIKNNLITLFEKAREESQDLRIANHARLSHFLQKEAEIDNGFNDRNVRKTVAELEEYHQPLGSLAHEIQTIQEAGGNLNTTSPSRKVYDIKHRIVNLCKAVQTRIACRLGERSCRASLNPADIFVTLPEIEATKFRRFDTPFASKAWALMSNGAGINDSTIAATEVRFKIATALLLPFKRVS